MSEFIIARIIITQAFLLHELYKVSRMKNTISNIIPENHISYRAQSQINSLLKPIDDKFGINYFSLSISYPNKMGVTLHNNAEFYESWFENELPMCQFKDLQSGWYFWENCSSEKMMNIAKDLNIGKGILHLQYFKDKVVSTSFAMRDYSAKNESFLMNNLNLLKGFSSHFLNEAKDIISQAKQELIPYLPNMVNAASAENGDSFEHLTRSAQEWQFGPLELLSKREHQCFMFLIRGFSMHEISEILELSPSSVNMYISRLKQKLKCKSRNELLELAEHHGIVSYHSLLPSVGKELLESA